MGHSLSASKRERQNVKRRHRNRGNMIVLRKELKGLGTVISTSGPGAKDALSKAYKALDRAARKNAIPKKRADRKKARLALAVNRAAKAAAAAAAAPSAQA
jgi:small subunit ribosomal protein S20